MSARPFERTVADYARLLRPVDALAPSAGAEPQKALIPPRLLASGDVYYTAWCGGGGYGDPLKRDPGKVARDVRSRLVSNERARDTYGVVLSPDWDLATLRCGSL